MGRTRGTEADPFGKSKRGRPPTKLREPLVKTGFDGIAQAPWRKTVSIFKQPVTIVHTTSRDTKKPTSEQLKRGSKDPQERPFPVFWSKTFENLSASIPVSLADKAFERSNETCYIKGRLCLGGKIGKATDLVDESAAIASLFYALHNPLGTAVIGQLKAKDKIDANPLANINPEQPLLSGIDVSQEDIIAQEKRVLDARKRLQEIRKNFFL